MPTVSASAMTREPASGPACEWNTASDRQATRLGPEHAFELQAGAGDKQADAEGGAAERVGDVVPDLWQRQMRDIDRKPDRAGPDQRIRQHVITIARSRLLFRRSVVASTETLNTLTRGMMATMATEASASPVLPNRLPETASAT